ncbi:MAG: MopE-related protein, partial [Myxococcota bacterium]|nr:MopE-related protein [Myxococcota bacterium]
DPGVDDGVACTVDACDEAAQIVTHTPSNAICDNGLFCDGVETCDVEDGCITGAAPVGDDGVACTQDVCDEALDTFVHNPNDSVCDDGKLCNGSETCDPDSGCVPGTDAINVDDGVACTIDSCDDATLLVQHLPDNTLCNDGLLCTVDICDATEGCNNNLADDFCLIDGGCYAVGASNPTNGCEECVPSQSTTQWSVKSAGMEICNGIDDDCDGATDEADAGGALSQGCANSCGGPGTEVCVSGVWTGCTAPILVEACGDGIDNDCDGLTDAPGCDNTAPLVAGAEVVFTTNRGYAINLESDNGDGTYTTQLVDLANPNVTGSISAAAYEVASSALAYEVTASAPLEIEVVSMRDTLYVDQPQARFAIQARDVSGRPVAMGTIASLTFNGANLIDATTSCGLDSYGRCIVVWDAPSAAFDFGGPVAVQVTVAGQPGPPSSLTIVPAPGGLLLQTGEAGLVLPASPRFPNATFDVPVYVAAGTAITGSYDIWIEFNQFMLQATAVKAGTCAPFGTPVSNLAVDANSTGLLKINAFNTASAAPCTSGNAVHVATVTFKVLDGLTPDDASVSASVSGTLQTLTDVNLVSLGSGALQIADGGGQSPSGQVNAWSATVKGILARVADTQLLDWTTVTGIPDSVPIEVTAYRRDYSFSDVSASNATGFSNTSPAQISVSQSGVITANGTPGLATVAAAHQGSVSTVRLRVLTPDAAEIALSDGTLQQITGTSGAPGGPYFQKARWTGTVTWTDGTNTTWTQNISTFFTGLSQVVVPSVLSVDFDRGTVTGTTAGEYPISLSTTGGAVVASTAVTIDSTTPVACTGLEVIAPCHVEMTSLNPSDPPAALGVADATATVTALLDAYEETCQVQVYAQFNDGTRMQINGLPGLTVQSVNSNVLAASSSGLLTAKGPGTVEVNASWSPGGTVLCDGSTQVSVDLPDAVGLLVTPQITK